MPKLPEVKKQLEDIGVPKMVRWTLGNELLVLAMAMVEGEEVRAFVQGEYQGKKGVLAATDTRLIFASGNGITNKFSEDFPYDKLSSIEQSGGLTGTAITIHASGNSAKIEKTRADLAQKVVSFTQEKRMSKPAPATPPPAASGGDDMAAQFERLVALKTQGALTEEEFAAAKKKLLGL